MISLSKPFPRFCAVWFAVASIAVASTVPTSQVVAKPQKPESLAEYRRSFRTTLTKRLKNRSPLPTPPASFRLVRYKSPVGQLPAYVSVAPRDGRKRPAIIWIIGGFGNDIGDTPWQKASPSNDQSASAFRKAGIITMYPARRGGNSSAGTDEGFYGEVDDVLAAARYLAAQPNVDANRIYLGGHSTGGTLAMLVAAMPNRFRGVFAFGPVANAANYGDEYLPFDTDNNMEVALRAPILWLKDIRRPTWVFEGLGGNIEDLRAMSRRNTNRSVKFFGVNGASHFSILAPITNIVAQKIARDKGVRTNISFTQRELDAPFRGR